MVNQVVLVNNLCLETKQIYVGSFTKPRTCTLVNFTGGTKTFWIVCFLLYSYKIQSESIF